MGFRIFFFLTQITNFMNFLKCGCVSSMQKLEVAWEMVETYFKILKILSVWRVLGELKINPP